jgi:hypothetical protein
VSDAFSITPSATTLVLDASGQATISFYVTNATGRPLRMRAVLHAIEPARPEWFSFVGEAEQETPLGGTHQYDVAIAVPKATPPGSYQLRLSAHAEDQPDEDFSQGPTVTITVREPAPSEPRQRFPWWMKVASCGMIIATLVLILVIVVIVIIIKAIV